MISQSEMIEAAREYVEHIVAFNAFRASREQELKRIAAISRAAWLAEYDDEWWIPPDYDDEDPSQSGRPLAVRERFADACIGVVEDELVRIARAVLA